ncbi:MAG: hypothetical protein ABI578_07070 [Chloroflexota bacterium]
MSTTYKTFFLVAAVYDIVLGAGFFLFYAPLFSALNVALPNNISYIHLTAAFVIVQGIGYWFVYQDPDANRGIVKLGVVYKIAFAGLSAYYALIGQLIHPVFGLFGIMDTLFLFGFVMFLMSSRTRQPA